MSFLKAKPFMKHLLMGYWLVISAFFFLFLLFTSVLKGQTFTILLTSNPTYTVSLLVTCLLLMMTSLFYYVRQISNSKQGLLGKFLLFAIVQQLLLFNFPGVLLAYLSYHFLDSHDCENPTTKQTWIVWASAFALLLFSLLVTFLNLRLKGLN
ncbi:hypothetical protein [Enterococcus lemanii]|uniref:Uncharacterized protein n=1 Tax=Enterococcus lemanii TaxID=1159752 RepID=A0ABV9MWU4_9ENTE|nr:hypothetical protein [Enterococcus lemanii]MBM7709422.1 hypothetical protein [Enterococcus lemanii]